MINEEPYLNSFCGDKWHAIYCNCWH